MINSDTIKKNLGIQLKKLRVSKNLTQEQLAEILNLQVQSITFIETGRTFISSEVLANICNYFNIEPDFLFCSQFIESTVQKTELKKDISRLISGCNNKELESIYNIIVALKK